MPYDSLDKMTQRQLPNDILLTRAEEFLKEGREVILKAKGNSMLPFIRDGRDSVALRKCEDPQVGDIVLVRLHERYVMHRIISRDGETFSMMGDGNLRGTEHFKKEDVLGKVTRIIRDGRREVIPGNGRLWRSLLPIRRWLLAFYRKIWTPLAQAAANKRQQTTIQ